MCNFINTHIQTHTASNINNELLSAWEHNEHSGAVEIFKKPFWNKYDHTPQKCLHYVSSTSKLVTSVHIWQCTCYVWPQNPFKVTFGRSAVSSKPHLFCRKVTNYYLWICLKEGVAGKISQPSPHVCSARIYAYRITNQLRSPPSSVIRCRPIIATTARA